MKKMIGCLLFCSVMCGTFFVASVVSDHALLRDSLIRMHVIANSDAPEDQAVKLRVRDAVCESIEDDLNQIRDLEQAKEYLRENLPKLERIANSVLKAAGVEMEADVMLGEYFFPARIYDTFRLPAGVYEALRIEIGEAAGENWWCVAFPSLCSYTTREEFQAAAAGAGFSEKLSDSLSVDSDFEIRFYLMDLIGSLTRAFP